MRRVIAAVILTASFLCGRAYADILLDRVVAVVNSEVITWSELYRQMESDAPPQVKAMSQAERRKLFEQRQVEFLEILINVKLQVQEANRLGLRVSEEELDSAVKGIREKYDMSEEEFNGSLAREGFSIEDYRQRLKEKILINKVVDRLIRKKIVVSEEDINRYLEKNRESMQLADSYRISQILVKAPQTESERRALREKTDTLLSKLREGVPFEDLAKEYSDDPSAADGGDMGLIKRSYFSQEFRDVLSEMKVNEVSEPFWTERGLHIIKLVEKVGAEEGQVLKEETRLRLSERMFAEKYNAWIKGLREDSFIEIRL